MGKPWTTWLVAALPLVGLLELSAHGVQLARVVPDGDWVAARDVVKGMVKGDDLVTFAPDWASPLGRKAFGDELITVERAAPPDVTRFPRALEVSIRGQHLEELADWKVLEERAAGRVTIRVLENPRPVHVLSDLVTLFEQGQGTLTRVEGDHEEPCMRGRGPILSGNLGFGAAVPQDRIMCPRGGYAAVTVLPDLEYRPRRCIYVPPLGGAAMLRITFTGVHFGGVLHGHHGLYTEAERAKDGQPVTLNLRTAGASGDVPVGRFVHKDGDGWRGFEVPTPTLAGKTGELVAEITSPNSNKRLYCFEADTR